MKKYSIAAFVASVAALPAVAQEAATADPFIATQGVDAVYVAVGLAFLAIAVAASSGTD